jgi:septal ring factor EnvC (AmiA/AmiB activator)
MMRALVSACAVAFALTAVGGAQPPDRSSAQALSRRAAERLEALRAEADRLAAEERTLLTDVRRLETERDLRRLEAEQARRAADAATADVDALDRQIAALTLQATAALPDLEARLVTLYKLGRGRYARLLLSASDLRQFGQAVRLVSALAEQDRQRVAQHERMLAELAAARQSAQARRSQLAQLHDTARRAQAAAEQALEAHHTRVREIDARRDLTAQYSAELLAAQQRLQTTLEGVSSAPAALPITPFKGDLPWPVEGTVRHGFGAVVGARPPLRGVEIATADAAAVHAVQDGTVAYADLFAGYGRLVILDHGNQTFSLYGNLGTIDVAKGARVGRGGPIGTAGLADGADGVVYFELRVDGRPVNPVQWLAKR